MVEHDTILVVNFGGQYAQLLARRVRELGVHSELVSPQITAQDLRARAPKAIILSGGPDSVYAPDAPALRDELLTLGVPVLGICYGMQALAKALGGQVARAGAGEYGRTLLEVSGDYGLLSDLPRQAVCWMSHRDAVVDVPGAQILASTAATPVAAFAHEPLRLYGVQFHPEVAHTDGGTDLLRAFCLGIAGARPDWTAAEIAADQIELIRAQTAGRGRVLCGLSGGVDSAVAALLVHQAVGDRLTCVLVDHGLLRHGEADQVVQAFTEHFGVNLIVADERDRFLAALDGVTEPEAKRKIIGREFIRAFERQAAQVAAADAGAPLEFLVQGTLYSDVIESGGEAGSHTIKSHHNVGGLPDDLAFELIEPLRGLFKDEVRQVGLAVGLPESLVWRQPFPGPGLGIRIVGGPITAEKLNVLRDADRVLQEEIRAAGLYRELWQSFCVMPDVRTVGVQGDERTYGHVIAIRAVTSEDAMTADWARLPYDLLDRVVSRMVSEIRQVNRVVLDITSKPPGTIEWE